MSARCPECGESYPGGRQGGHCRGGEYGGCCLTFSSDSAFDHHRTGPFAPDGQRRCADVTVDPAWRLTRRGWTDSDPMPGYVPQVMTR